MDRPHHRTVDRVAALLEAAALAPEGSTLTELARRVGAPVSSVQKLVDGLVATGYLAEAERTYTVGPAPSVLSMRAGRVPLRAVRHRDLAALAVELDAPVVLAVRMGSDAVYVDWAGASEAFDYALSARLRAPLLDTAVGRVLAAHRPETERRALARAAGGEDPARAVAVLEELAAIRRDGRDRGPSGPLVPHALAVAVPVREDGGAGPVVAAVAVTAGEDASVERLDALSAGLGQAAARWSSR